MGTKRKVKSCVKSNDAVLFLVNALPYLGVCTVDGAPIFVHAIMICLSSSYSPYLSNQTATATASMRKRDNRLQATRIKQQKTLASTPMSRPNRSLVLEAKVQQCWKFVYNRTLDNRQEFAEVALSWSSEPSTCLAHFCLRSQPGCCCELQNETRRQYQKESYCTTSPG